METTKRPSGLIWCGLAGLLVVAGCSGTRGPVDEAVATTATTTVPAPTQAVPGEEAIGADELTQPTIEPWTVAVTVTAPGSEGSLSVDIDPDDPSGLEPFGTFADCSGLRDRTTAYSVSVRRPGRIGPQAVSVHTDDAIDGPGTYPATIRVEPASASPIVATGTVTLRPDLRSGMFAGFDGERRPVSGEFECSGVDRRPVLTNDVPDGIERVVEVAALLSFGGSEELVQLTAAPDDGVLVECPGEPAVRVEGGTSVGSLTAFELTDGTSPSVRLQAGGATYDLTDATMQVAADGSSGSFTGITVPGVTVTGAFRCA